MANANQVIVNGKTILDLRSDTVTPETLQKGYTAHDKSGTKITGTLEASSPGVAKETWIIKDNAPVDENSYELAKTDISFSSAGAKFAAIQVDSDGVVIWLNYYTPVNKIINVGSFEPGMGEDKFTWQNNAYRKLTFDTPPTGDLLTWLQANGVKQPDDTAVQDTKALTITSNGTVSVTPDAPYDALKKVDVTVDVASGGGGETTQLRVGASGQDVEAPLYCVWQTSDGWMGTATFDTSTAFTVPNVIVGGYVIFTHDPNTEWYFSTADENGVENIGVGAMNAEGDLEDAALVIKVTAPSPSFIIRLLN